MAKRTVLLRLLLPAALVALLVGLCHCLSPGRPETQQNPPEQGARAAAGAVAVQQRDPSWAVPLDLPGLPNLHRVSPGFYRGAQPTAEGFQQLKAMGIKTIVNLRFLHSDKDLLGDTGLSCESIPMTALHAEDEDAVRFLRIVTDPQKAPVFVHCEYGADRTGTMTAIYRVAVQEWTKEDAIREMTEGGFGFHSIHQNLPSYIRELDIDALKRRAGLSQEEGATR
jgi:protein tyrosine phosphatase (PTP) superfamily phosphohydrolase (DUF442 family)